jgi:outer membrane protein assembly factor BamE (lipoprotein component of BamABCDE complex)
MKTNPIHLIHGIRPLVFALLLSVPIIISGCISRSSTQGVVNLWRADNAPVFVRGKSTEHDVLSFLGPPSQVISAGNRTVFYYLVEQKKTKGIRLLIYNQTNERFTYDRAIFFFDAQGRLTDFATSYETVPLK